MKIMSANKVLYAMKVRGMCVKNDDVINLRKHLCANTYYTLLGVP